jgi:hypothetical protein
MRENLLLRCATPGMLVAALCLLPFLGKAFTIDDPYFLAEAQQALRTPRTPASAPICWENVGFARSVREVGSVSVVMGYVLIPVILLHDKERAGHLLDLFLLFIAIVTTVALAFRCGAGKTEAMLAGVFLASFPVVLIMAGNIMPDILAMTLGVIGIERLLAWKTQGGLWRAFAAGVALGLAPVARSHTMLLLPVGFILLTCETWPPSLREWLSSFLRALRTTPRIRWLPLLIAVACFLAVTGITFDTSGGFTIFPGGPNTGQLSASFIGPNMLQFGLNWMAVTPFAIAWLLLEGAAGFVLLSIALLGGAILKYSLSSSPVLLDVLGLAGLVAIGSAMGWAWRSRRVPVAGLGLCLLLTLGIIPYFHFPSKYLAPCAPAASILLALRIFEGTRAPKAWSAAIVLSGAALGVMLLNADAAFAGLARRAVAEAVAPQIQSGHRAWYSGQWALTWYAEQAGAACLSIYPPYPEKGDVIVAGEIEGGDALVSHSGLSLRLLQTIQLTDPDLRIMNPAAHAGFYSNAWGYLPWAWSSAPVNTYRIWSVE